VAERETGREKSRRLDALALEQQVGQTAEEKSRGERGEG
jgi:hypothetical protein